MRFIASLLLERKVIAPDLNHPDDEPLLSVKSLSHGHSLDVAMLAASSEGHLVSVGLDRIIQVWNVRSEGRSRVVFDTAMDDPFPVLAMAIDDESAWVAFLSSDKALLWNLTDQRWESAVPLDLRGQKPEAFFFSRKEASSIPPLIVVKRNGKMLEVFFGNQTFKEHTICKSPLISAVPLTEKCRLQPFLFPSLDSLKSFPFHCRPFRIWPLN